MQWIFPVTAIAFLIGGATVFAVFAGTAVGFIVGTAMIAAGVAFVIFAVF